MDNYFGRILARLAPRSTRVRGADNADLSRRLVACEAEVLELRREVDELRMDSLRIAELYDLVFERLKSEAPVSS